MSLWELFNQLDNWLPVFLLTFARMSALLLSMPILGYRPVSVRVRIMMALVLSFMLMPLLVNSVKLEPFVLTLFVVDLIREVFIGLVIGFGARILFDSFLMAGKLISFQMGLTVVNAIDPATNVNQPIIVQFYSTVLIIFFLLTNSHYLLIETLYQNFRLIPLGKGLFPPGLGETFVSGGSLIWDLGLKFAAPAMIFLIAVDIAIAFAARMMPQMNVFFVTLPVKIGIGIFMLILSLKIFQTMFGIFYDQLELYLSTVLGYLAG